MTNIVPFPVPCGNREVAIDQRDTSPSYEFSQEELASLCRWYSAMKYAFPQLRGVMAVCHRQRASAVGLYGENGAAPNCLISKHETAGRTVLMWATEYDAPRPIASIEEIIERHIRAIEPPRNEASWIDAMGWMKVLAERMIASPLAAPSPGPA